MLVDVQDSVEGLGKDFSEPDDDWVPVGFGLSADGTSTMVGIDPQFFSSDHSKDLLVEKLRALIIAEQILVFAMVVSTWQSRYHIETDERRPPAGWHPEVSPDVMPRDDPNRREAVVVAITDADGTTVSSAEIIRFEDAPPALKDWEQFDTEGAGSTGRFVEPFRDAIQIVRRTKREQEEGR